MKIDRERQKKKVVLLRERLHRYPYSYDAAKVYHEYLTANPGKEPDHVKMEIEEQEVVEDRYGHGGYDEAWVQLYEEVDETDEEYEERIERAERWLVDGYREALMEAAQDFRNEFAMSGVVDDHWASVKTWQEMAKLAKERLEELDRQK